MTGKKYFEELRLKINSLHYLEGRIEELREMSTSLGKFGYDEPQVQVTHDKNHYEKWIVELVDLSTQYESLRQECVKAMAEADLRLMQMSKDEYARVLRWRFLDKKRHSWGWIADEMGFSEDRVKHICGDALTEFERKWLS